MIVVNDIHKTFCKIKAVRGVDFEELITLNGPVKSALNDWLTWRRPKLADAYENYLFLRAETAPIFEKANLPEASVSVLTDLAGLERCLVIELPH